MSSNLSIIDNLLILLYFVIVLAIGLAVSRSQGSPKKNYFLAGKSLGWIVIGSSLFATSISSEHLVGLAGAGSLHGLGVGYSEWLSAIILLIMGWAFAPMLLNAKVYTVPQFFGKMFNNKSRVYLTIVSVFTYLFLKIGVALLAGGLVMRGVLGWDMLTSTIFIVLLTGLYTAVGGMNSVVFTQVFQVVILILGVFLLSWYGLTEIGGLAVLSKKLPSNYFDLLKPITDLNLSSVGILIGAPIIGIWYWCSDQYIIQRILGARSLSDAKKGTLFAAFLKIFPIFFLIIPGLIAAILYPSSKGDEAFSMMLSGGLLPVGIKGIVIAGFFAALMSSLSGAFNSAASLFALDIYGLVKPKASEDELVLVGRLSTMFLVIITIAIIPSLKFINSYNYFKLQDLQAYIAPPIVSVLLVGIFWKNASGRGAIWALLIGGFVGFLKLILTILDPALFESMLLLRKINDINYLHFAIFLFVLSAIVIILFSLISVAKAKSEDDRQDLKINKNEVSFNTTLHQIEQKKILTNKSNVK